MEHIDHCRGGNFRLLKPLYYTIREIFIITVFEQAIALRNVIAKWMMVPAERGVCRQIQRHRIERNTGDT